MAEKPASKKMAAAAAAPKAAPAKPVASPTPPPTTSAATAPAPTPPAVRAAPAKQRPDATERHRLIQEAAYYRSIAPGATHDATAHWLAAEREVDRRLSGR